MAHSLPAVYVKTFERTVQHLAQQGDNRLRNWCQERYNQSTSHAWELLASAEAVQKAVGRVATPDSDTQFSRRISNCLTWHMNDFVEPEGIAQTMISPISALAESHAKGMRRIQDKQIITRALGTSQNDAGTVAFLAGQTLGSYTVELNFDLVTQVTELFLDNDVDPDEPKCFVIGPKQARKLLQLTEASSADFNAMRPLQTKGYVDSWMGYSWILSNQLTVPAASQLDCFAMTKRAMGFHVAKDIWVRAEEDPSSSYDYAVYTASTFGAVRVHDKELVWVKVADTVA